MEKALNILLLTYIILIINIRTYQKIVNNYSMTNDDIFYLIGIGIILIISSININNGK